MENEIFKALADPSRRTLLDLFHESDGRTLNELCAPLEMSRFGVMKHSAEPWAIELTTLGG